MDILSIYLINKNIKLLFFAITKDNKNFKEFRFDENMPILAKKWLNQNCKLLLKLWDYELPFDEFLEEITNVRRY
jgi:hypothetical protein